MVVSTAIVLIATAAAVGASVLLGDAAPGKEAEIKTAAEVAGAGVVGPSSAESPSPEALVPSPEPSLLPVLPPKVPGITITCPGDFEPNSQFEGVDACLVHPEGGFTGDVALSCSTPAAGATCFPNPASVTVTGDPVPFLIAVSTDLGFGDYEITVAGTGGLIEASVTLTMHLDNHAARPGGTVTVACSEENRVRTIPLGQSGAFDCLAKAPGEAGSVELSCASHDGTPCLWEPAAVDVPAGGSVPVQLQIIKPGYYGSKVDVFYAQGGGERVHFDTLFFGVFPPDTSVELRPGATVPGVTCPSFSLGSGNPDYAVLCYVHVAANFERSFEFWVEGPEGLSFEPPDITSVYDTDRSWGSALRMDASDLAPGQYTAVVRGTDGEVEFVSPPVTITVLDPRTWGG